MNIGIVTRSFPELTNKEVSDLLKNENFTSVELCFYHPDSKYWVYNGRSDISTLTDEHANEIIETYRKNGIAVTSIGVFTNLLEPDEKELQKNIEYFERHMEIAGQNNVPYVSTECGFIPGKRGVQTDTYETAFLYLVKNFKTLCELAEKYNVYVALEACVIDPIPSAKRVLDFIKQVASPRLKVLLDPANLIANSSEEDMFKYLSPHIAYFHGKDRKVNDTYGRVVGDGDIDWPLFLSLYHRYNEGVPFILEYVKRDNFTQIRDRVFDFDKKREEF